MALLSLTLAGTGMVLEASRAEAQGLFGNWDSPPPKPRKKVRRAPAADEEADALGSKKSGKKSKVGEVAERPINGPLVISVSLARQRLTVFDATGPIAESPISSGRVGYSTPTGVFTVLEKRRMHYSNLYAGAPMPNMQRITWSGVALHAGVLPGYPASHGCIRLPHGFSKKLFGMTKNGTRVIVSRDPVTPISFAHDRLFAAFPPETDAAAGPAAPTQVADASAMTGSTVSSVLGVSTAAAAVEGDAVGAARSSFRERRRLEAERLSAEIRTAGYEKASLASVLAKANEEAEAARKPLVALRAEADSTAETLGKLEKAKARGERELAALQGAPDEPVVETKSKKKNKKADRQRKPKKVVDKAKREARIAELNDELAELPPEIEAARVAAEAVSKAYTAAQELAEAADQRRRAALADLMKVNATLQQALAKEEAAKRLEARRHLPVSVFVSRAKQRLYIRQGYDDILDVAVTIDRPEEPIGTHVFTALDFAQGKTAMNWTAVSVPYDPTRSAAKKKKKADKKSRKAEIVEAASVDVSGQTPAAALERITIPEDVREQIADVMKPGSSLVISDHGLSNETGKYTDLIAAIR